MLAKARNLSTPLLRSAQIQRHFEYSASSKMPPSWDRLVRYVSAKDGKIRYGEPIVWDSNPDIDQLAQDGKLKVKILEGANPSQAQATGEQDQVKKLLGPLAPKDVPIIRCVGLNYKTHSKFYTNTPPASSSDRHAYSRRQSRKPVSIFPKTQQCSSNTALP